MTVGICCQEVRWEAGGPGRSLLLSGFPLISRQQQGHGKKKKAWTKKGELPTGPCFVTSCAPRYVESCAELTKSPLALSTREGPYPGTCLRLQDKF